MENITIFNKFIRHHNKKEIFLTGFYVSFLLVMFLAMVLDFKIGNDIDAYIELLFVVVTSASFAYYLKGKNNIFAINSLVLLSTLTTYSLLVSNAFDVSVFHIIVPLGYFLLFSFKRSMLYFFIHQMIVICLYWYGYDLYPASQIHNPVYVVSISLATLVILFFGIFYHIAVESTYHQLEIANNALEKSNYQKEILLNEIHHRIKNSLHLISSLLGLQQKAEKDPKLTKILEKNRLRIQSIAMIHEALYTYDSFEEIAFDTYTKKLCDTILELYDNKTVVMIKESNIYLSIENTLRFGIITNELLTNSLKHAFSKESGEVTVSLTKTEDSYIYKYHDDGKIEIDEKEFMKYDTLGLKIIHMMVEQMEGDLCVSFDGGFDLVLKTTFCSNIN